MLEMLAVWVMPSREGSDRPERLTHFRAGEARRGEITADIAENPA
jgi:hypothetical protein